MTFKELVDSVLAGRFPEGKRSAAKDWVNYRQAKLLALEEWTFLHATDDVTVTTGAQLVTGTPTDLGIVTALFRSDGTRLEPLPDHRELYARYYDNVAPSTGLPEAFAVVGGSILVGPASSETKTDYKLIHERVPTALVEDGDISVVPVGFHMALVFAARATGRKLAGDPTWQSEEAEYDTSVEDMRRFYLTSIRGAAVQVPAYTP